MAVDGRLAMANQDHHAQGKRLDFAKPKVLQDNWEQPTLRVTVASEIRGIATNRKKQGTSPEREFPREVAETSSIMCSDPQIESHTLANLLGDNVRIASQAGSAALNHTRLKAKALPRPALAVLLWEGRQV
jgi:hypothetical protein